MENQLKYNIAKMKADIKVRAEEQVMLKNQRKSVHIIGERKVSASDAAYKHYVNKSDLRIMYAAYGLARGKSFSQTENKFEEHNHPLLVVFKRSIDRILESYVMPVEVPVQE